MGRKALRVLRDWEMRRVLVEMVDQHATDAAAARSMGVSRSHLSRVLRGEKPVDGAIAHALGYERHDCYVPYEHRE